MNVITIISLVAWALILYVCISFCAIIAALCVLRPARWRPIVVLLLGLMGALVGWQYYVPIRAGIRNPNQAQNAGAPAWIQWRSTAGGNNHWYALTPSATNWLAAQDLAVSWGANLATIRNAGEQDFINNTFLTGAFESRPVGIGLVRKGFGGNSTPNVRLAMEDLGLVKPKATAAHEFERVSGELVSYGNWKSGQPDNFPPGEQYGAINWFHSDSPPRGTKGDWNDAPLKGTTAFGGTTDGPYFGLVERKSDPTRPPILTAAKFRLPTLGCLLLAAVVVFISFKKASRLSSQNI
jgi:hypothetical protein